MLPPNYVFFDKVSENQQRQGKYFKGKKKLFKKGDNVLVKLYKYNKEF